MVLSKLVNEEKDNILKAFDTAFRYFKKKSLSMYMKTYFNGKWDEWININSIEEILSWKEWWLKFFFNDNLKKAQDALKWLEKIEKKFDVCLLASQDFLTKPYNIVIKNNIDMRFCESIRYNWK